MKKLIVGLMIAMFGLFLVVGCEKDTGSALSEEQLEQQSEQYAMNSIADDNNEYLIDWGIDDVSEDNMFDGFSTFSPNLTLPKMMAPINNVVRFGRKINNRFRRRVEIVRISPDSLFFKVTRELNGRFVIFEKIGGDSTQPDTFAVYRKPMRHLITRNAIFVKRTNDEDALRNPRRRWKLASISLSKGESRPVPTVEIHKLAIATSSGDTFTYVNPLRTKLEIPGDLPTFLQGETVTVIALVSNSTVNPVPDPVTGATETVLLHFGINRQHHARKRFHFVGIDPTTGYGIYKGQWVVHEPANRPFHAVVDVIDNGTIYDSDTQMYPYNSATWGCPYRVVLSK
ncbi:MAG TPA: hypothetical protein ENK14_01335 [Caldithrix sp.]|nr:hypothetical protein [Caldithrix sp.]